MPIYEFVCRECDITIESFRRDVTTVWCPLCGQAPKRRFSFNTQSVMQEHWNTSVGARVSDPKQFRGLLNRKSDEASERLGMTVNYQPVDIQDKAALGVTDEGMDVTYAQRRATGQDTAKRTYMV